jgi:hypothetical protein
MHVPFRLSSSRLQAHLLPALLLVPGQALGVGNISSSMVKESHDEEYE